jgi:hypothetical protein
VIAMRIDSTLQAHILAAFAPLNDEAAVHAFPPTGALSKALLQLLEAHSRGHAYQHKLPAIAKMFTTASVNMWMRAVHAFLVSASLTEVSPAWSSVAGYYSSHYSVRALAHLLGHFQMHNGRRIVRLQLGPGTYNCKFDPKGGTDREHKVYWKIVKQDPHFAADSFFRENNSGDNASDVSHRDRANYADHVPEFPLFRPLDAEAVRNRINRISDIETSSAPIPRTDKYPDIENVQIVAYHRLVRFRSLVDTVVVDDNRFWRVHRDPPWARDFMDYQLTDEASAESLFTR